MNPKFKTYFEVIQLFAPKEKIKILMVAILQVCLSLLDLAGVVLMGMVGVVAVTGVTSQSTGTTTEAILNLLRIAELSFQEQVAYIGILAATLLIAKTVLSLLITRRSMLFLSTRAANITVDLLDDLLHSSVIDIESKSTQEQLHSITQGVTSLGIGVIGSSISLISDISLLILISVGITILNPITALNTFALFLVLGILLHRITSIKAERLGIEETRQNIESNRLIVESINTYRELFVHNRQTFYTSKVGQHRRELANTTASLAMMPNISKYIVEITLLIAGLLVSAIQFATQDAKHATATLAVFLASGTRIAPALLRIQQGLLVFNTSLGNARSTLEMIESLRTSPRLRTSGTYEGEKQTETFSPEILVDNLVIQYPSASEFSLKVESLKVLGGESIAIVGPSGAGKTTLADAIMGLIPPSSGRVKISGASPIDAISAYPGKISYVPQHVQIVQGTIASNVALGFEERTWNIEEIQRVLRIVQLESFAENTDKGLFMEVQSEGSNLSGGQRQRLGIARALYTSPEILILDESTSSLDAQTEFDLNIQLTQLKGKVTLLVIAHRLSTVKALDRIIYLEKGAIQFIGTFSEVRAAVPEFNAQAELLNL